MSKKKKADSIINKATDNAADALRGVPYQKSAKTTNQFNAQIDKASELASARAKKKQ